jgi:hypothetical protein
MNKYEVTIIVFVLCFNNIRQEFEISLPFEATSVDVVEALLEPENEINRYYADGQKIQFVLLLKKDGKQFPGEASFGEMQVRDGDEFILTNEIYGYQ